MQTKLNIIDVHELKRRYETNQEILLIDVRELSEWNEAHIPWAEHVPKGELSQKIESLCPDRNTPIYLQCRSGARSQNAGQSLLESGYQHVYSVAGGIIDWMGAEYDYALGMKQNNFNI